MDILGTDLITKAFSFAGTAQVWRLSWTNTEILVALNMSNDDDDNWIFRTTFSRMSEKAIITASRDTILVERTKDVTHLTGIQFFINYILRTRSWMERRQKPAQPQLCLRNLRRRNICQDRSIDYLLWLKATAAIKGYDGTSKRIPIIWLWNNPFYKNGKNYDDYGRPTE